MRFIYYCKNNNSFLISYIEVYIFIIFFADKMNHVITYPITNLIKLNTEGKSWYFNYQLERIYKESDFAP